MCNYCEKIWDNYDELDNAVMRFHSAVEHGIVRDGDKYNLGIPCADNFYAPEAKDIKFCPYCGRKLE